EMVQVFEGRPEHPAAQRLQEAVRLFKIPREALNEIIAGVEMDLDRSTYETFEDIHPSCYRVASAVGLCCIELFGYSNLRAREYAVNLGVALQLTNIMRDVEPDARAGRFYLPQEDLKRFGVTGEDLAAGRYTSEFVRLMEHEAARARPPLPLRACVVGPAQGRRAYPVRRRDHGPHLFRPVETHGAPPLPCLR